MTRVHFDELQSTPLIYPAGSIEYKKCVQMLSAENYFPKNYFGVKNISYPPQGEKEKQLSSHKRTWRNFHFSPNAEKVNDAEARR